MSDCCAVNLTPEETPQETNAQTTHDCCAPNLSAGVTMNFTVNTEANVCPECGTKGKKVDTITVKGLVAVSLRNVNPTAQYYFCKNPDCATVYFCADGGQSFTKDQLREPVHQKEPAAENVPVCYCFGHTPASIRAEIEATGKSTVVDDVNTGIKAGQCACEVRNPQGSCCLGNVRAVVKEITLAVNVPA